MGFMLARRVQAYNKIAPVANSWPLQLEKVCASVHKHEQRILNVHNVRGNAQALYELFGVTPQSLLGG